MTKPSISIIVPIYNAELYMDKCIQSIINQTYSDIEIILVNDGSTDKSMKICNSYAINDSRVVVINKPNGGVSSARNSGLKIANGDYIGFVDSDDYIDPRMYEELLTAIIKNNADIAECGYSTIDMNYNAIENYPLIAMVIDGSYNCSRNYLSKINTTNFNWNKLYNRLLFNGIEFPNLSYSEDYIINVKTFYMSKRKVTINGCYYYYLQNDKGAVHAPFGQRKLDAIIAGKEIFEYHQERYSDLCPFIALYITGHILRLYRELRQSESPDSEKFENLLLHEFKKYYPLIKGDAYKLIRFKKKNIVLRLFNRNPKLYYFLKK